MCAEKRRLHDARIVRCDRSDGAQHAELRIKREAVAGLHFDVCRSGGTHERKARAKIARERLDRRIADRTNGRHDAATRREDVKIRRAGESHCHLAVAFARGARVRVAIDKRRENDAAAEVDHAVGWSTGRFSGSVERRDHSAIDHNLAISENAEFAHRRAAPRAVTSGGGGERQNASVCEDQSGHRLRIVA